MLWKDFVLRLRALFFRRQVEEDLQDELQFHLDMQARKNRGQDVDPAEAGRRARVKFGSVDRAAEECRDARGISTIEILIKDVRFGLRMLRKSPSFTAVAVVTLALAIGANAVVFGVMNGLVLRPLNLPEEESLYSVEHWNGNSFSALSYPNYVDLRERNRSFEGLAAFYVTAAGLDPGENPSVAWVYGVSGNYFDVLGIKPYVGRFFHGSDDRGPNSAPYIVLSYKYWHAHFQDDRSVAGRTVLFNKNPYTIIGVAPPEFRGTFQFFSPDLFVPLVNQEHIEGRSLLNERGNRWLMATFGHLKAGVTPAQAMADLNSIGSDLEKTYPNDVGPTTVRLGRPGLYLFGGLMQAFFAGMMVLAALVLLAACANLGSLFAARAADRSREVALRLALGATRTRILRQLFTEAVLISLIGGAAGIWVSAVLLRALSQWNPMPEFNLNVPVTPDATVYAVALLLTLTSGFLFGAVPVRQVLRTEPYEIVKSGSIGRIGRRVTVQDALLVAQIAICAVLVTSSLVAVRGLVRSLNVNFGFEPRNALLLETTLSMAGYRGEAVPPMQRRMIDAMQAIPGVTSAAFVDWPPLTRGFYPNTNIFTDEVTDLSAANRIASSAIYSVSPDYFDAAGAKLLEGRQFSWHDDENAPHVAVVSREFARTVFGSATNVAGRYFKGQDGTRTQVVGIVEDGKHSSLTEDLKPAMFVPVLQRPSSETSLVVRSNRDPQQLAAAMRSKIREIDSSLPVQITPWSEKLDIVLFPSRVATVALAVLGVMAAMLSVTGIFGVAAYSVSKRKRELGIRIALGAQRKEVLQAAVGRAFRLLALGSLAGLFLGILAGPVLAFIVYQANPRDPLVLAGVVLAMLLLGLLAAWIPARRAVSIDPLILLREE